MGVVGNGDADEPTHTYMSLALTLHTWLNSINGQANTNVKLLYFN